MGALRSVTASVYLAAGRLEEARAEVRRGLAASTERNARGYRAPLLRLEAEVLAGQEPAEPAAARERLREALALAAALGSAPRSPTATSASANCTDELASGRRRTSTYTTATTMYREMDMRFSLTQGEAELKALS